MSTQVYDDDIYEDGEQNKDDKKLVVMFYYQAVKDEIRTKEEGRPCFVDVEYIKIIIPGQRDNMVTEVTDTYRSRFRKQYENWKARVADPESGTPLSEVPWLTVSQITEFAALNVKTVEQLVGLPDATAQRFMGIHDIQARAKRYMEVAAKEAPALKLEADLKIRDEQIADQANLIKQMKVQLDALTAAAGKPVLTPPVVKKVG